MKIIGGSFGLKGKAWLSADKYLVVEGDRSKKYQNEDIASMTSGDASKRKFSLLSFIVGALILGWLGLIFLGILGLIIGIIIAVAGSFYSEKKGVVTISFKDNSVLNLECTQRGSKKLFTFWGGEAL